jgi:hypothetical protein
MDEIINLDTWHLTNIPKIMHVYWGNKILPFLRYMTIYSFYKLNPDWKIILHIPNESSEGKIETPVTYRNDIKNYWDKLKDIPTLTIHTVDFGDCNKISEVHKSDLLRWQLLGSIGGIWSDMDLLYFRPITKLHINTEQNKDCQIVFINYTPEEPGKYALKPIGFLMSEANSPFYQEIERQAKILLKGSFANQYDNYKMDYQLIGTKIISNYRADVFKSQFNSKVVYLNPTSVYRYIWNEVCKLFYEDHSDAFFDDPTTIGCHWYGGAPVTKNFVDTTTLETYKSYGCTITSLINNLMGRK